jgi:hypothetical protein
VKELEIWGFLACAFLVGVSWYLDRNKTGDSEESASFGTALKDFVLFYACYTAVIAAGLWMAPHIPFLPETETAIGLVWAAKLMLNGLLILAIPFCIAGILWTRMMQCRTSNTSET